MRLRTRSTRSLTVLIAGATIALLAGACGDDGDPAEVERQASPNAAPAAQEVLEQEFPDIDEQNAAAAVRRFYDVLGKTPKAKQVGIGCVVDDRLFEAGGDCEAFRMDEMAADICPLLSKQAIGENYRELYPAGYKSTFQPGLDKTDQPKDYPQRLACLQGMGIFLRQVKRDGGLEKAKGAKIVDAKVEGENGTVTVTFPNDKTTKIQVVKQKDGWKFVELAGQPNRRGAQ